MKKEYKMILYSKDSKDRLRIWEIKAEGNSYFTRDGIDGGKVKDWVARKCIGKNIGKSNATTDEQQAISEMENKITCKLQEGYYKTKEEALNDNTFTPMLAHKYDDYKGKLPKVFIMQPKLDGARCNIYMKNGELVVRTRSNRDYVSVPHLLEKFKKVFDKHPTWVLDGELYNHELKDNFEDLMSLIRQSKPTKDDLKRSKESIDLYIYDVYDSAKPDTLDSHRRNLVGEMADEFGATTVGFDMVTTGEAGITKILDKYLSEGYEGAMIRLTDGFYKPNGRSKDLLKVKIFQDEEFKILDVLEGNGQWSGCAKKITVDLGNGQTCEAGLKGTQTRLKEVLKNKKSYIGKLATVTYFGRTNTNSLRFPVCKDINRHD